MIISSLQTLGSGQYWYGRGSETDLGRVFLGLGAHPVSEYEGIPSHKPVACPFGPWLFSNQLLCRTYNNTIPPVSLPRLVFVGSLVKERTLYHLGATLYTHLTITKMLAVPGDTTNPQVGSGGTTAASNGSLVSGILPVLLHWWYVILPSIIVTRALYKRYASPLRQYPGPWLASCSRLWKVLSTASTHTHLDHVALHEKYGPIVRIAPDELSLASPEAARTLLSAGKRFYKTRFYGVFPPPENPDIFTEYREDVHAQKKKVANVPYSMSAMQQLSPFIDDTIEFLMKKMDSMAEEGGRPVVDLGNWLHWFAFDVLGEVAFSRSFGFLEQGKDVDGAIHTIDESQRYNGIVGQVPFMDFFLRRNPLWKLIPWLDTKNALITRMALEELGRRKPFDKESEGKWRGGDGRRDLLASLIQGHLKDPQRFGEGDVFAVAHGAM